MFKTVVIVLIVLWLCLAGILAVNIWRQYQVGRLQMRMLDDYKMMSEVPDFFDRVQDSLYNDAQAAEKTALALSKPFPINDSDRNWLLMRLAVILLALFSIAAFWFYYKKKSPA